MSAEHEAAPQIVPTGQSAHAPAPLQEPLVLQVLGELDGHSLSGSVPATIAAQVPSVPPVREAEHALQVSVHALWQQTPSTQNPLPHWLAAAQALPVARTGTQLPPEQ